MNLRKKNNKAIVSKEPIAIKKKPRNKNALRFTFKLPRGYDQAIHFSMIALILVGSTMILTTSVGSTLSSNMIVAKTVFKQVIFIVVGYSGMLFFANNFTMVRVSRYGRLIAFGIAMSLVMCLFFYNSEAGTRSWIVIPYVNMTIQPSEFAKVMIIVLMAAAVEINKDRRFNLVDIVKVPVFFFILFAVLICLQPDAGTLIVIGLICAVCFLIPTHPSFKKCQKAVAAGFIIFGVCLTIFYSPLGPKVIDKLPIGTYQKARFYSALDPFGDVRVSSYQLVESLYAFARGGVTGAGFGSSVQKFGYLPEAQTDYILAIVVEETGITGFIVITALYFIIIGRLFFFAFKTHSEGYKIILIGTSMYLFVHFILNVGGVTGLIPLSGLPLLFISSGGSSLIAVMVSLGITQSVISRIKSTSSSTTNSNNDKLLKTPNLK